MNFDVFTPSRLTELRQHYQTHDRPPPVTCGTVRDFCDSMDHLPELATIQNDLKDLQRPWALKAILRQVPIGGRILEIGAGDPYVAELLARCGYDVTVVDPYDGSGNGPVEFEAFRARHPNLKIIRQQFGTHLTDLPEHGFDCIYSISVLEHIPLAPLTDVLAMARRCLKPDAWHIHAVDHVYIGTASDYHLKMLNTVCAGTGAPATLLNDILERASHDPDVYFLAAEAHNRWRGKTPYDQFPMRRCMCVQFVVPAEASAAPNTPVVFPKAEPTPTPPPAAAAPIGAINPWNEPKPFDYSGLWFGCKTVQRHINQKITGSPDIGWLEYVYRKYMSALPGGRCLILGASEGHVQRDLRRWGFRGPILATDIADVTLSRSRIQDQAAGLKNVSYLVADLNQDTFDQKFDFIIAEGVLHHIGQTEKCIRHIADCLTLNGLLLGCEFEGPFRFQLPPEQLQWINAALAVLPMSLRPLNDGLKGVPAPLSYQSRIHYIKPTIEEMIRFDPSEAVGGPTLKRLVPEVFRMLEKTGCGGTLLSYMSSHFPFGQANNDPCIDAWLKVLLHIEDTVISQHLLDDDFVFYVCARRET